MDRNTVLAVILISLIMTVWLVWYAPQPPETESPAQQEQVVPDTSSPAPQTPEPSAPVVSEIPVQPVDSTLEAASTGDEREIIIETEVLRVVMSTRGATPVSVELKKHFQHDKETPVELVDPDEPGALSIEFTTPSNRLVSTRQLFFEPDSDDEVIRVVEGERRLVFSTKIGGGTMLLTYTFVPASYEVRLDVTTVSPERFMTRAGYEVVWNGGLPFAEGPNGQEANVAAALVRSGGEVEKINLVSDETAELSLNGTIEWLAVRNGFFAAVTIPQQETSGAELEGVKIESDEGVVLEENYTTRLLVPDRGATTDEFRFYLGPIDYYEVKDYGLNLYDLVDYGFGQPITRPIAKFLIIPVFQFLSRFLSNYGIIIIIFAFLIKLVLAPLTTSSFKSMAKMRKLQPEMKEIREKYSDDPQKQQQAMMKLYQQSGVNPLGGCLPQLLQLPILYALFRFFPSAIEIRQEGFLWCSDLSAPDTLLELPFSIPLYGTNVAGFPIMMAAAMILQMRLQGTHQQQTGQMKVMTMIMPVFILFIFNRFAAGLSLYYLTYNIVSAVQQKLINRQLDEDEEESEVTDGKPARSKDTKSRKHKKGSEKSAKRSSRKGGPRVPGR